MTKKKNVGCSTSCLLMQVIHTITYSLLLCLPTCSLNVHQYILMLCNTFHAWIPWEYSSCRIYCIASGVRWNRMALSIIPHSLYTYGFWVCVIYTRRTGQTTLIQSHHLPVKQKNTPLHCAHTHTNTPTTANSTTSCG